MAKWTHEALSGQIVKLYQSVAKDVEDIVPKVNVLIHRRRDLAPTDVRFLVMNRSDFPTSVKTTLDAELNGRLYGNPVPGHYSGDNTWDLPANQAVDGHFSLELFILEPAGLSYDDFRSNEGILDLRYRYSVLTSRGHWKELGGLKYRFDHRTEDWLVIP